MRIEFLISIGLYAVACCLPALEFKRSWGTPDVWRGWQILAFGWSGIFAGVLGWLANPLWVVAFFRPWLVWIAVAIACTIFIDMHRTLPGDEGGVTTQVISRLLLGYYFWIASLVTIPIAWLLQKG